MLDSITPLILCRDEEPNIARTLGQLAWAREVIVVDSFSRDATVAIARRFPNVRLVQREFDSHAAQWTYGASLVTSEWTLALDADYFISDELTREMSELQSRDDVAAYEARFIYAIGGKRLRASLYPDRPVLVRRGRYAFWQDGHTQRIRVDGASERLRNPIVHDDRKSLARFIERQRGYMRQEAAKLRATPWRELNATARLRKLRLVAPFVVLVYTLFVKGTILDGLPGLHYAFERFVAELILSAALFRS
jgi:glycosyltransferase involved in cell wall biosynthesis